ncbi:MAG: hypothetical protein PHR35_01220 [Kiritimatiellae bacterium]|nr:hypothetical protein [Kiritimatiellia bacterium]
MNDDKCGRITGGTRRGVGGVVFGRNAIQVPDAPRFQRALCDVVKRGMTPEEAIRKQGLEA